MKVFFTADLHLGHINVLEYCNRPFATVEEMNACLIENWNKTVTPKDHVYVLGDVAFVSIEQTSEMLKKLKGTKFLVAGNHDARHRKHEEFTSHFAWVKDYHELKLQNDNQPGSQPIVLSHYPFAAWNRSHYGSFMLHGHSHGKLVSENLRRYDVGVDCNDFKPVQYEQLRERLLNKPFK